ncbi:hypothetical protein RRF57_011419 [Xylaria bambusicola]|uniref:Uncharacterized protein n=1 Tax=Xylaria bambusicola TaxID=326684 RepID=A0AAN7ZA25_9PEZI
MAPNKKNQQKVTDLSNRTCHLASCKVVVGSKRTMCPVHSVQHAENQAALRQKRKDDLKCTGCGSEIDNPYYFTYCAGCRFKKSQYQKKVREERKSSSGKRGENTQTEAAPRQQQSFIELVCNPYNTDEADVAEMLLQMSKPRESL